MIAWLANELDRKGHEITLLTFRENVRTQQLAPGIKHIHHLIEGEGNRLFRLFRSVLWLVKHLKRECYDLAIAFLIPSQIRLVCACRLTRTKVLISQRGDPYFSKGRFLDSLIDTVFMLANYFVFQTEGAQDYYPKRVRDRSTVIPNPVIPIGEAIGKRKPEKRIVSLGRLEQKQKRQDILIRAYQMLPEELHDYKLEFWGDGEDREKLESLVREKDNIHFCGATDDVLSVLKDAALFVLSSDYEGIPNALIEAMSFGIPCISTDCSPGGARMLIESGKNGIIVPINNPSALCNAIAFMLMNPSSAEEMGKEGKKISEKFCEAKIGLLWDKAVNSACQ